MEVVIPSTLTKKAAEDLQLIEKAKAGCQRSYSALMERHYTAVYHHLYQLTKDQNLAEELTQEAFSKALTRLATYVPHHAFSTWLYKIAKNGLIDHRRKKRLRILSIDETIEPDSESDFTELLRADVIDPEEAVIREQRCFAVRYVMYQLNPKYRQMIELRYYEEFSYEEIASELDIPLGTVKAQLHRAKELMGEMLMRPGADAYLEYVPRRQAG